MLPTLAVSCFVSAYAFRAIPLPHAPAASPAACAPLASSTLPLGRRARLPAVGMQQLDLDEDSKSFYAEYVETDPATGESKALTLGDKEKLYLECLDAYYNEDGKQLLSNEDYEQLKLDIDFEGSRVATFSADEIKFVLANKRFKMGKSILSDSQYDALRAKLKAAGSPVVIHEGPKCEIDGSVCKNDMRVDDAKTRLLYLPGTVGGSLLLSELFFWTLHIDPLLSIVLGAVPSYFFGVWFTENVFAQKPLVTTSACPNCGALNTIYFGDLFSVMTDGGLVGPPNPPKDVVEWKCESCKEVLEADRTEMIIKTTKPKVTA